MNLNQEDQKKALLMTALLVVLGGMVYYNFFMEEDEEPTPRRTTSAAAKGRPAAVPVAGKNDIPVITEPLMLASLSKSQEPSGGRNIFIYPTPTPPPPPKPQPTPPPPPITLSGLNPAGVIGKTGDFTLTVFGAKIPADARVFIAGREQKTTVVSETQLKAAVGAGTISNPGSLPVEVRSATDAKLFSNVVNLNISPPPAPPYKYLGLIIKGGVTSAALKFELEDGIQYVRKDAVLGGHWKIINITDQEIEFEDTNIKVRHRIPFSGEGG